MKDSEVGVSILIWLYTYVCVLICFYGALSCRWSYRRAEMLAFIDKMNDRRCFDGSIEPPPVVELVQPRTPFVK